MREFYQHPAAFIRCILFVFVLVITQMRSDGQTILAPGDLAFVGYITTDDGVDGSSQDDEFSFILLKDITAGTVIRFTDFGWLTSGGFQTPNSCGPNTGAINDGIILWTATSTLTCGTQVTIQSKYTLTATSGIVTGVQATANTPTAYLSLAAGGDQIFAYQGTHAAPAFIAGISINKPWDASLAACFFSSNSSVLPAALGAGSNNVAIITALNAHYNCALNNALPASLVSAINTPSNWQTDNTYFAPIPGAFQLPVSCTFGCNAATITVTGTLNPFVTCAGTASVEQSYSVSATGLTANLIINAPSGYEISTTSGSGFGNMITLVPTGGNVSPTTIYVRLESTATGTPSGNITHSSTGATTINQPVSGTVNPIPDVVASPASQTVCSGNAITTISFSGSIPGTIYNWTRDNTGTVTGIAASGSGDISGTLVNTTAAAITVTFTITPVANNCPGTPIPATVTVNTAPTITCPVNIITGNTAGQCGAAVNYNISITGTPSPTISYIFSGVTTGSGSGDGSGSFFNVGTTTVTLTALNSCGTASCSFTITVNDTENPQITCPAPVTVSCASNVPTANPALVTATDNCPGVSVAHMGDVISNQTCTNRYTITRTYRATDAAGNFSECIQIITVNDQTAPTLTCPAPVTVSCASQVPAANIASVTAVSDNCGGTVTVTHISDVISNQTCANRYTITRTYRATDVCGNFAECTQSITVNDQTPPTITCPANQTVSCASAVPVPNIASVVVSDNCGGIVTVTHTGDIISGQTCANRYTIARTYRATDVCGNFAECTQIIIVNDQTAPVITCPANITVTTPVGSCTAIVNYTVTASDNCGGAVTISSSPASGAAFPIGTTTVIATATDACGNSSTCNFTVTVIDAQLPVITTQPATQSVCEGSNTTFNVVATNATGYQWQQFSGGNWQNIGGATNSSYTVNNVTMAMNTNTFRVIVMGLCSNVTSSIASLVVNPLPNISIHTTRPPTLLPGQFLNIIAVATPGGGSFAWYKDGILIPGANGPVLQHIGIDNLGTYYVIYTDTKGCVKQSASITITGQPSNNLYVYPNPNNGEFQVRFYNQNGESITVKVYDGKGSEIYSKKEAGTQPYTGVEVDISGVPAGNYLVVVFNGNGQKVGSKIILIR